MSINNVNNNNNNNNNNDNNHNKMNIYTYILLDDSIQYELCVRVYHIT